MDAIHTYRSLFFALISILFTSTATAGYFGASQSFNKTATFDTQEDGLRVDFGSDVTPWLDLEWSYIDYGHSTFDDPTFNPGDDTDDDDNERYENIGFGNQRVNEQTAEFTGITNLRTQGIAAGLKFKKSVNNWLQLYARVSFMAWYVESTNVSIYQPRDPYDAEGNQITNPDDFSNADNLNGCGHLDFCRIEDTDNPNTNWAVDFWYGYGAIIKPYSWLAIRTEYSIVTLNAVDFPKSTLEGFSAGLEIFY